MAQNKPLVGICIPTYENVKLIDRAINSILSQSYDNYIIIVTDDSKTNSIESLVKDRINIPVIYHRNERRLGATANTNEAITIALEQKVDLIKLLHQDDWFTYDYSLAEMVRKLMSGKSDILFCGNMEIYSNYSRKHICMQNEIENIKEDISYLFRANVLGAPSNILYKAQKIFFDSTYTWLLDVDFYLRLLQGKEVEYIYEPLISIGHDGNQISDFYNQHPWEMYRETISLYSKYKWLHTKSNRKYLIKCVWDSFKQVVRIRLGI